MTDLNSSTRDYLKNYFSSQNPRFAVLLSAPWGAGKTHLINELIEEEEVEKPLYISLFGVGSRSEIDRAIVRAMWPKTDSDVAKIGTQVKNFVSGIRGFGFSFDLSKIDLTEVMLTKLPNTLIFDDFERATLSITELLGAINGYVEHQGKRVVLLANEDNLWGEDGIREKEKVIGQTLSLVADFDTAIDSLIDRYGSDSKNFLGRNVEIIKDVFVKASYNNLRSLGQAIWEFERFFKVIEAGHVENEEGMKELLFIFLALTLEVKSGNFTRIDLQLRGDLDYDKNPKFEKLRQASEKFKNEHIRNGRFQTTLPYELAEYIICDGGNDRKTINEKLALTPAFHVTVAESEWQTVWWAFDREENAVEPAASLMETKFLNREYLDPGIILLVFSSRLDLPEMGYAKCSIEKIETECVKYIEDLLKAKKLTAYDPKGGSFHHEGYGYSDTGHLGMGFPRDEAYWKGPPFNRLYSKMQAAQMEAYQDSSGEEALELLKTLEENPDSFVTKISNYGLKEAIFSSKPVLKHLPSEEFVKVLFLLSSKHRKHVLKSLQLRYKWSNNELESEKPWLKDVYHKIIRQLPQCSAFSKWQTENNLKHSIGKTLESWEKEEAGLARRAQSVGDE
ncbi:MAG: P-loop NTPase fold protein [Rhizobiaceae bacterium]